MLVSKRIFFGGNMYIGYQDGEMFVEQVDLAKIAAEVGTPFYCYSYGQLAANLNSYRRALAPFSASICYSVKANSSLAVVSAIAALGGGADVVSGGELFLALRAGIKPENIVFSGVGKTEQELADAVLHGIQQINVESAEELQMVAQVAQRLGKRANVALRVNPDVDALTHVKITTGKKENKFGVPWTHAHELYHAAQQMPSLNVCGIAVHIGSQLLDLEPFRLAFGRVARMVEELEQEGISLQNIDLGGGLGINYNVELPPTCESYAEVVRETLGHINKNIIVEPGRSVVGNAGILVTRVIYTKQTDQKLFIVTDAGMNDLIRPAMYDAWHSILPVHRAGEAPVVADIVGPICESGDVFAKDRIIEPMQAGRLLAIMCAGAYGASMASTYNFRPLPPEVMVRGDKYEVVRPRQSYEQMLAGQTVPEWIQQ